MTDQLKIEDHGDGVVVLRMTRLDKKNALTGVMYDTMRGVMQNPAAHGAKAIVFAGGPGAFTAGNDIADFIQRSGGALGEAPAGAFIRALTTTEVPMIAAVDGLAIGVGVTMLLHMDLAYASPRATFKMPFIDLGLVPEAASSLLLPQLAGLKKATQYMLLAETFSAGEAREIGLVNAVVEPDALEATAIGAARRLAQKPPNALAMTRRLIRGDQDAIRARMDIENRDFSAALQGAEAKAAFMAFMARK